MQYKENSNPTPYYKTKWIYDYDAMPQFLDVSLLTMLLNYHPKTIRAKLRSGEIKGVKVGKEWRVDKEDVKYMFRKGVKK